MGRITNAYDIVGKQYGYLTVVKPLEEITHGKMKYLCKCRCGSELTVSRRNFLHGSRKMCSECRKKIPLENHINRTHGQSYSRIYRIWSGIKRRCFYEKAQSYKFYGSRGITICDEWKNSFENFYEWSIKNGYTDELTIERIDVNGNYCPENCKWIPLKKQYYNRRNTIYLTYKGETKSLNEWSDITGVRRSRLYSRYFNGWTPEQIMEIGRYEQRRVQKA